MSLYQHGETGRLSWFAQQPNGRWYPIPIISEHELPDNITQEQYVTWWEFSRVIGHIRFGPKVIGGK